MDSKELLKVGFKEFNAKNDEPTLFQKKITDKKGIKYFINCYKYTFPYDKERITWEFHLQTEAKLGTIDTALFYTDKNIKQIEKFIEKVWIGYGSNYYELFAISEDSAQ